MEWIKSWNLKAQWPEEYTEVFHIHNNCEMLYLVSGEVTAKLAEKTYKIKPGMLVVASRFEAHGITPEKFPYERIVIQVESDVLHNAGISPLLTSVLEHHPDGWNHVFDLSKYPEIKELLIRTNQEINSENPMCDEMAEALLYQVLVLLYRNFPERFINPKQDERMEEARKYIEEHLSDFPSVQNLSKQHYMTTSHFIVRFKKHTGYTPQKYYNICRIARARYLLLNSSETLSSIAEQVGFPDVNSFVRAFRSTMGIAPGKFREKNIKEQ